MTICSSWFKYVLVISVMFGECLCQANQDAPECQKFWDARREYSKQPRLHLPHAARCPATRSLVVAYDIVNGRAQDLSLKEIMDFATRYPVWPHRKDILQIIESQVLRRASDPRVLEMWFRTHGPQTTKGMMWYGNHLETIKNISALRRVVSAFWVSHVIPQSFQNSFWDKFHFYLTPSDHQRRIVYHALQGDKEQASWTLKIAHKTLPASASQCFEMLRKEPDAHALSRLHPSSSMYVCGLIRVLEKIKKEKKKHEGAHLLRTQQAFKLLRRYDQNPLAQIDPKLQEKLFQVRESLVRTLIVERHTRQAYDLITAHGLSSGDSFVTAETLSGWLALRFQKNPQKALEHFQKAIKQVTKTADWVDLHFWLGETWTALKRTQKAQAAYRQSARYGHSFYGQQAFFKLAPPISNYATLPQPRVVLKGQTALTLQQEKDLEAVLKQVAILKDRVTFENFSRVLSGLRFNAEMVRRVLSCVEKQRCDFITISAYASFAKSHPDIHPSLLVYPRIALGPDACPGLSHDLVFAVIRHESAFDTQARGGAGEYGLMQLMPGTAAEVGHQEKIFFKNADLLDRPQLNIHLGYTYLQKMRKSFPQASFLPLAAYNAGPGQLRRWIETLGLPSQRLTDIDWIESIPFETRHYVKVVLANAQMYHYGRTGHFLTKPLSSASYDAP